MLEQLLREIFLEEKVFVDYVVIDPQTKEMTDTVLVRKRLYFKPFIYGLIFKLITLGFGTLRIRLKTTYYRFSTEQSKEESFKSENTTLSKKDYRACLEQQRILYSTAQVPDHIVADICSPSNVKYKLKMTLSAVAFVLSLICSVFVFFYPADLLVAIPLWWWYSVSLTDLKDAKIKKELYDRYLENHPELTSKEPVGVVEISESTTTNTSSTPEDGTSSTLAEDTSITFENNVQVAKKRLTNDVIRQDLHLQKNTIGKYLEQAFLIILMIVVVCLGRPSILIMGIFLLFNLNSMIFDDIQRARLKYVVLDRKVLKKTVHETDDDCIHKLWFDDENCKKEVAINVPPIDYQSVAVDEECYIVILKGDQTPCLFYRKSKWIL